MCFQHKTYTCLLQKKTNVCNIEYIHIETLVHGGLDLADSSMLTTNSDRRSPSTLEKMAKNPFPPVGARAARG
jgi:hypothetical protein